MSFNYKKHAVVNTESPIITKGRKIGGQVDHTAIIRDVPAYCLWGYNSSKKLVPLYPYAKVASVSDTAITVDSSAQATEFDPTSDTDTNPLNKYWLSANSGNQNITFFDKSATDESPYMTGAVASEEEAVSSVAAAVINVDVAFSEQPADEDIIFPGGLEGGNIGQEAVIIPREVTVEECEEKRDDFFVEGYAQGTVLSYNRLTAELKQLYDWDIIPTYGTDNIKVDLDR